MESASNIEAFRGFFFRTLLAVSACAALVVALGDQSIYHIPAVLPGMRVILLAWVALHAILYFMSRKERAAGAAYLVYVYSAFVILTIVFQSIATTLFDKAAYQLPQNYSLLFVGLLLLPRGRYLVFSTVVCGTVLVWTLLNYGILSPPVGEIAISALVIHTLGQWFLSIIASMLMDSYFRQMLDSRAQLAQHNERLAEEVAAKAEIIRQQQERLFQSQKMEAIGQLAGGIAHDFNNLLTIIQGNAELLVRGLPEDSSLNAYADEIIDAGRSSAELIQRLLAFSRRQVMELRVVNLNAVVEKSRQMLARIVGDDISLESSLDPSVGTVRADISQIEQVIINLVVNARDAMPNGGRISIITAPYVVKEGEPGPGMGLPQGRYAALSITDTGAGMAEDVIPRVFEPFFTTKESGKGTGLGLATVYGIVKQLGGEIELKSRLGQGSSFTIYLPVVSGASDAVPVKTPSLTAAPAGGSETVLLVEDKEKVRKLVAEILRTGGYTVLDTGVPADAPDLLSEYMGHVHLLCTDVMMPGMSGVELAAKIREISPATRLLFMSGYADKALVQKEILDAGLPFIDKPFTPERFLGKVRQVLDASVPVDMGKP